MSIATVGPPEGSSWRAAVQLGPSRVWRQAQAIVGQQGHSEKGCWTEGRGVRTGWDRRHLFLCLSPHLIAEAFREKWPLLQVHLPNLM